MILVPYAGQLRAMQRALQRSNFKVVLSVLDADILEGMPREEGEEEEEEVQEGQEEGAGEAQSRYAARAVRVATVDNFQVYWGGSLLAHPYMAHDTPLYGTRHPPSNRHTPYGT